MKALDHVTTGRTAIRALLIAIVLTAGIAGTAAAEPMDGKGNGPYPAGVFLSLDGKGNDPYPAGVFLSLDGKGNDAYPSPGVYAALVWSQDMDPY